MKQFFKFITPFRVFFNLDSSKVAAQPAVFVSFLEKVDAALADTGSALAKAISPFLYVDVNVPKSKSNESDNARDPSRFYLAPHILTLRFHDEYREKMAHIYRQAAAQADKEIENYASMLSPDLSSVQIRINDNTVAVLSMDLGIDTARTVIDKDSWSKINDWAAVLVKSMLRELYPDMIFPLLKGLNDFSNATKDYFVYDVSEYKIFFVLVGDPQNPYPDLHKRFIPMKTNVTLSTSSHTQDTQWAHSIVQRGTAIHLGGTGGYITDENNLITLPEGADSKKLDVFWDVILSASYYYTAMNVINVNLIRYIGITADKHSTHDLRIISRDIEKIINSVTILKVRYNDLASELTGEAKKVFQAVQTEWGFKNIADNMQNKLDLCRSNIQTLSIETQRRNQGRIETVLTGVAGVSVVGVFIDLASYAAQMPPENMKMVGTLPGFVDLGFQLSANALSWIGIAIAALVLLFTIKHRSG